MVIKDDLVEWDGHVSNWCSSVNGGVKEIEIGKIDNSQETVEKKKKRDRLIAGGGSGVKGKF